MIDLRGTVYDSRARTQEARFAISGELQEFRYRVSFQEGNQYAYAAETHVRIQLRVYDLVLGTMAWEKPYSTSCSGGLPTCFWTRALQVVANEMATDPELVDQLNRR